MLGMSNRRDETMSEDKQTNKPETTAIDTFLFSEGGLLEQAQESLEKDARKLQASINGGIQPKDKGFGGGGAF